MSRRLIEVTILFVLLSLLATPRKSLAAATVEITSYPTTIHAEEDFTFTGKINGLTPNSTFSYKVGAGPDSTHLNYGRVYNQASGGYLSYMSLWSTCPTAKADESGSWQGQVKAMVDKGAPNGQNLLRFRIQYSGDKTENSGLMPFTFEAQTPPEEPPPGSPPPPSCPSGVFLSEFMAYPDSEQQEWVEIYNSNGNDVNLSGWYIDDVEGGSSPSKFDAVSFVGKSYYVVYLTTSKLNNTGGDSVRLLCPDESVVDQYSYTSATKGLSWAKGEDGKWYETTTPTAGGANKITAPKEENPPNPPAGGNPPGSEGDEDVPPSNQKAKLPAKEGKTLGSNSLSNNAKGDILPEAASHFRPDKKPGWHQSKGAVEATSVASEATSEATVSAGKNISKGMMVGGLVVSLSSLAYLAFKKKLI